MLCGESCCHIKLGPQSIFSRVLDSAESWTQQNLIFSRISDTTESWIQQNLGHNRILDPVCHQCFDGTRICTDKRGNYQLCITNQQLLDVPNANTNTNTILEFRLIWSETFMLKHEETDWPQRVGPTI